MVCGAGRSREGMVACGSGSGGMLPEQVQVDVKASGK
jgi:hypothetical protein